MLGCDRAQAVLVPVGVVGLQPRVERVVDHPLLAHPEETPAREPALGELVAHLVGDVVQAFACVGRAALGDEPVEHRVHDRAAIDRAQLDDVLGLFDGVDAEHVPHEVGVRAARPLLQARRGDDDVGRGRSDLAQAGRERAEVAVEPRELRAAAGREQCAAAPVPGRRQRFAGEHGPEVVLVPRSRGTTRARCRR